MPDEDPKSPFSEEQTASLKTYVSQIVNSAMRSHLAMADKKRAEDREAVKTDFAKLLDEKLASLKPSEEPAGGGDGKGSKRSKEEETVLATMRKQLAETAARVEAAEKRAAEERAKNEAHSLQERVSKILSGAGIEGNRFRGAYAVLKERIRKQGDEADSQHVFVDDTGEEIDLEVGLRGWTKGDEAKIYLPPSGAAGSGARRAAGTVKPDNKQDTTFEDVGNFVLGLTAPMGGGRLGE